MSSVMFNQQYGPWALIAGGSDGVGAAFAREVASRGVNLVLIGRRLGPLDDMSSELRSAHSGLQVRIVPADLGDDNAIEKIKADTADLEIGCLIYNAGSET